MRSNGKFVAMNSTDGLRHRPALELCFCGRRWSSRAVLLGLFLIVPYGGTFSQQSAGAGSQFPGTPHGFSQDPNQLPPLNDPYGPVEGEKRLRMINAERQKSMISDADKLLKLATELNQEIARSNAGDLSAAQLHKVAEIEKLAHNVRDKMVMSVRGPQLNNMDGQPPGPYFPPRH